MSRKTPLLTAPVLVISLALSTAAAVAVAAPAGAAEPAGAGPVFTLSVAPEGQRKATRGPDFPFKLTVRPASRPLGHAGLRGGPSGQRHGLGYDRYARDGFFFR